MNISEILSLFKLSNNEQEVYLILNRTSWITVLELSKKTTIKRTSLYRVLESLLKKGLIDMRVDDKTTFYAAGDVANFQSVIVEQERITQNMRDGLAVVKSQLDLLKKPDLLTTSIHFYRGKRSLQSMQWKMLGATSSEILIFGANSWDTVVGQELAEEIRQERVRINTVIKELLNQECIEPIPHTGAVSWTNNTEYVLHHFLHRCVDRSILDLKTEIVITAKSIFTSSYEDSELVGVELISSAFANTLRQLFQNVWNQAQAVDNFGGDDF